MSSGPRSTGSRAVQLEFPWGGSTSDRSPNHPDNRDRKLNLLRSAKARALKLEIPFELDEFCVEWNQRCPVLGIELDYGRKDKGGSENSPSIDRLDPDRGYIADNVAVVSVVANRIKNNAEAATIRQVADWLEGQEE